MAVAPEEVLRGYEDALESLGFRPGLVEAASLALLSAAAPDSAPGDRLLVNWDEGYVSFVLTRAGHPLLLRTLPGDSGRAAVARHATSTLQFHRDRLGGGPLADVVVRSASVPGEEAAELLGGALGATARLFGRGRPSGSTRRARRPRRWRGRRPASCGGPHEDSPQPRPPAVPERTAADPRARRRVPGARRGHREPRAAGARPAPGAGPRRRERGDRDREGDRNPPRAVGRASRGRSLARLAQGVGGGQGPRGPPDVLLDGPPRRAREGAAAGGEDRLDHSPGRRGADGADAPGRGSNQRGRPGPPPGPAVARRVRGRLLKGLERGARWRRHLLHRALRTEGASGGELPTDGRAPSGAGPLPKADRIPGASL